MVTAVVLSFMMLSNERIAEERQFDFWIGEWDLSGRMRAAPGKDEWIDTKASNTITSNYKGKVIREDFKMEGFSGMSVSVYSKARGKWLQTWVDDSGGYIALEGEFNDGKMILQTQPVAGQPSTFKRMVFHDIKADSFTWDWEGTADGGKSWELLWRLEYRRR